MLFATVMTTAGAGVESSRRCRMSEHEDVVAVPAPKDGQLFTVGTRVRISDDGQRIVPDPSGDLITEINDTWITISRCQEPGGAVSGP
jgi:hypothetical protein